LNLHPPKHPQERELCPRKKKITPLQGHKVRCISVCSFFNFQKTHPIFSIQKKPLGRALRQHQMCSLAFPRANATVQLLTSTIVKTATARRVGRALKNRPTKIQQKHIQQNMLGL